MLTYGGMTRCREERQEGLVSRVIGVVVLFKLTGPTSLCSGRKRTAARNLHTDPRSARHTCYR